MINVTGFFVAACTRQRAGFLTGDLLLTSEHRPPLHGARTVQYHPFADVFPLMEGEELTALVDDIRQHGLREPIVTFEGKILDGRNRQAACIMASVKPKYREFKGDGTAALQFVWSENFHRRMLNSSQKAVCWARLEEKQTEIAQAIKNGAKRRQKEGGKEAGSGRPKKVTQKIGEPNRHEREADAQLAKVVGTNRQYIADARKLPEEQRKAVESGKKTLSQAKREVANEAKRKELAKARRKARREMREEQPPWTLVQKDVLDGLQDVIDNHSPPSLIFADPPYNVGVDYYGAGKKADRLPADKYMLWVREWLELCRETLTPNGSLWVLICDEYAAEYGVALKDIGFTIRSWIKWYETFGVNCSKNFNRTSRHLFYCVRDRKDFVFDAEAVNRPSDRQSKYKDKRAIAGGKTWDDVWTDIPRLTGTCDERIPDFPTQLPLKLLRPIIGCSSMPGDLIVDPFCGSATTGVVCLEKLRKFFGIEKNEKAIEIADQRMRKEWNSVT